MENFPPELNEEMFKYMGTSDIVTLGRVSRQLYIDTQNYIKYHRIDVLWKEHMFACGTNSCNVYINFNYRTPELCSNCDAPLCYNCERKYMYTPFRIGSVFTVSSVCRFMCGECYKN